VVIGVSPVACCVSDVARPPAPGVPDPEPKSLFVITAYELRGKPAFAYRRRRRKIRP